MPHLFGLAARPLPKLKFGEFNVLSVFTNVLVVASKLVVTSQVVSLVGVGATEWVEVLTVANVLLVVGSPSGGLLVLPRPLAPSQPLEPVKSGFEGECMC